MHRPLSNRSGSRCALPALIALLSLGFTAPAFAEKRIALVVGNSAYQNIARLDNPRNDAVLMADTLAGLGFTLIGGHAQLDLDKSALDIAVQDFGRQIQRAPEGTLISYATQPGSVGAWVVVSVGTTCSGSSTTAVVVSSGKIIGEGLSGSVSRSGTTSSVGNYNGITVISSGHVSGRSGSGSFKRSDGCIGRWAASKQ